MNSQEEALAKACCADLYQSPLAQQILGDPPHPGGLTLTNRLGRLMGIAPGDWVLDLASARGTSAMAISRVFRCNVVGLEFGAEPVVLACATASEPPKTPRAFFLRGDAERPPMMGDSFDAVLCECSMSLFADKPGAVTEAVRVLKPGGRLGLSDMTVEAGALPEELQGYLGQVLCLAQALNVSGYVGLLEGGGLTITHQEDASDQLVKILDEVEAKLGALSAWRDIAGQQGSEIGFGGGMLNQAPQLLQRLRGLVNERKLGYWLFAAQKA
ncbi:MAG: hypothetical protein BZY88_05270 [SAR202 cluster bacterium Io17-Chloro-G9]|nr:MAG: hypothetical protein BZY88_05270 [SAR202 cluster bacterium Io17-Chloro-G9]